MAAGNETKLTPSQVREIARKHRTVADGIRTQLTSVNTEVQTTASQNKGAMVNRLVAVHEQWDASSRKIVLNLEDMATTLDGAATGLESQDSTNAGGVTT